MINLNDLLVTKASKMQVPFSAEKLKRSMQRSGASATDADVIVESIKSKLYEGVPTHKIYKWASKLLHKNSKSFAARYHLKSAIMELGPTGFAFESFISELIKHQGFQVTVGELVKGKCVTHEIDVIAQQGETCFLVECKYHNQQGIICDVKVPLYIKARFEDIGQVWAMSHKTKLVQGWLVTNTRFSEDAIKYGTCAGLKLLGWDYPFGESLQVMIDELALYPITCLTTLTRSEKQTLLDRKIILIEDLDKNTSVINQLKISEHRIKNIFNEVNQLRSKLKN